MSFMGVVFLSTKLVFTPHFVNELWLRVFFWPPHAKTVVGVK